MNYTIDNVSVREMPVIKWAPHSLLTYSEDLSNAAWNLSGSTREVVSSASPIGTDAYKIIGNTVNTEHKFFQNLPSTYSHSMTVAVFAKADGYNFFAFRNQTNSVWGNTNFNLSTGQVGTVPNNVTASMTDVGNGWYLCKAVYSLGLSFNRVQLNSLETDNTHSFAANGTSGTLVWGAHLYRSDLGGMADNPDQPSSRASYVPTTSAAKYLARIGHHVYNENAWVNEGVLAESESRTNLIDYSDFSSGWIDGGAGSLNLTENSAVSPDGTQNALELESTGSGSSSYIKPSSAVFLTDCQSRYLFMQKQEHTLYLELQTIAQAITVRGLIYQMVLSEPIMILADTETQLT